MITDPCELRKKVEETLALAKTIRETFPGLTPDSALALSIMFAIEEARREGIRWAEQRSGRG